MPSNSLLRLFPLPLLFALLSACGSVDIAAKHPFSSIYCDDFMIYDICARDSNRDGVVDFVYFADTNDIFMYREGAESRFPDEHGVHRCARAMDENLVTTTSRLFYIDDETTYLEKQDIRGAMMIRYIAQMPEVTACNMRAEEAGNEQNAP